MKSLLLILLILLCTFTLLGQDTTFIEIKKLLASDPQTDDYFGNSVSITGDYAVVGAFYESDGGSRAGAAYVFHRNQGGTDNWGEVKKLTASDPQADDFFGYSVSICGDYAVIGAYGKGIGESDTGAAYIFYRNQGGTDNWGQVKKLIASDAQAGDNFGNSVSISGDYAIVGAKAENSGGISAGAAYVFYRNQGGSDNWGEVKKLSVSDAQQNGYFGCSVCVAGDYAVVGAFGESTGFTYCGAAYVFYRNQGGNDNWGEVKKLIASDAQTEDYFGNSVSISGDYAVIGAYMEDTGGSQAGAAYVFYRNQGGNDNWGEVKKLTASDAQDWDYFGQSVSISGDSVFIGASGEDTGENDAGAAYVFYRNQGGNDNWGEVIKIIALDGQESDYFGQSVCLSGDYSIVGADYEDSGGSDAGAAYVLKKMALTLTAPNGGETWRAGELHNITWASANISTVKLEYTTNNGTNWTSIATGQTASTGTYAWTVPSINSTTVKVKVTDEVFPNISDESDENFIVGIRTLTLIAPNGGETWRAGESRNITWTPVSISTVKLEYTTNYGTNWTVYNTANSGLPLDNVLSLALETSGKIWVGTFGGGIAKFDGTNWTVYNTSNSGLPDNGVYKLAIEVSGDKWIGTSNGGLAKFDGTNWTVFNTANSGLPHNAVFPVAIDASGNKWIGTANGLVKFDGTNWTVYNTANSGLPDNWVVSLTIDVSGDKWIGTNNGGLAKFDGTTWTVFNTANSGLPDNYVRSITMDDNGNKWIATSGGGLAKFDGTTWTVFNTSNSGLPHNGVYSIAIDANGNKWIGTAGGLAKIDGTSWTSIAMGLTASTGYYAWTIPSLNDTTVRVKVTDEVFPNISDESDENFTIKIPTLTLNAPNGGETWRAGESRNITWTAANISTVKLEYTTNNGTNWTSITTGQTAATGTYAWTVPSINSTTVKVKVTDEVFPNTSDQSDVNFTIQLPTLTLNAPNGGETWQGGESRNMNWTSENISTVKLEYTTNNGTNWTSITTGQTAATGTYAWTIPRINSNTVKLKVTDEVFPHISDESNANFTIQGPTLTLTAPNGGETWRVGEQKIITWNAQNIASFRLDYTTNNGTDWITVATGISGTNAYLWTIPNTPGNQIRVRVKDEVFPNISDASDNTFTITAPALTLTSPNGGETWRAGELRNITWTGANIATVKLEYTTNNGIKWTGITAGQTASTGTYAWTVPSINSTIVKVKVTDEVFPNISDQSNANFTIQIPTLTLTAPNGGDIWRAGELRNITWAGANISTVKLEYTTDNGTNWTSITTGQSASNGTFEWTVPTINSTTVKVKVTDEVLPKISDESDAEFTIQGPTLTLTAPNGGEIWRAGEQRQISWSASNTNTIKLEYTTNSGTDWNTIGTDIPAPQQIFNWVLPDINSSTVIVRASDQDYPGTYDQSDAMFSILRPVLTLYQPNGRETYASGSIQEIIWSSVNIAKIKIEFSPNGGNPWETISDSVQASLQSFDWIVNSVHTNEAIIRITDISLPSVADRSDSGFTIINSAIAINSPSAGEIWRAGEQRKISWISSNINNIELAYSTDNGSTWEVIISGLNASSGNYVWTLPQIDANSVYLRLTDELHPDVVSVSAYPLRIVIPSITLSEPKTGDVFRAGSQHIIRWSHSFVDTVNLYYSTDAGSSWAEIAEAIVQPLSYYTWILPPVSSSEMKVKISDKALPNVFSISPSFEVYYPEISLIEPIGSEKIRGGSNYYITWNSSFIDKINISYSSDGGGSWNLIANEADASPGKYSWQVPSFSSENGKVLISETGYPQNADTSASAFMIFVPHIELTNPVSGMKFRNGDNKVISWTSEFVQGVDLEFSADGGITWSQLVQNYVSPENKFSWSIPEYESANCRIKVKSSEYPDVFAESELFEIFIYVESIPLAKSVVFNNSMEKSSYRMLGLPGADDIAIKGLFKGNQGTDWQVFHDKGTSTNYLQKYDGSAVFNFGKGKAFWVLSKNAININDSANTVQLQSDNTYFLQLHEGWNIITNPFNRSVLWSDVQSVNSETLQPIYDYQGSFVQSASFAPFNGYYLYNSLNLSGIKIPYVIDPQNLLKRNFKKTKYTGFTLELIKQKSLINSITAGYSEFCSGGIDSLDIFAPPQDFASDGMIIYNSSLETAYKFLLEDHRAEPGTGQEYELRLRLTRGSEYQLQVASYDLPKEYLMLLYDKRLKKPYDIGPDKPVRITALHTENEYLLLAGNSDYIEKFKETISPAEFMLFHNYPNPFNPETVIRFSLPAKGIVTLRIYNILGEAVETLIDEVEYEPGYHEILFDGRGLASGVYIYSLTTGDKQIVKKMTLMK